MCFLVEVGAQLAGVDQVPVVGEADSIRRVDVEGLTLGALHGSRGMRTLFLHCPPAQDDMGWKEGGKHTELVPAVG